MTIITFAVTIACLVVLPELLAPVRLFDRVPHAGLLTWVSLCCVGWLGAVIALFKMGINAGSSPLVPATLRFVRHLSDGHPLRGLGMLEVVGLSLAADIVVLFSASLMIGARQTARRRSEQRAILDLLATSGRATSPVHVLDHAQPLAYYLPGDGGRVVVSAGTIAALSQAEFAAVVAHEHGHRHGGHGHLLVPLQTLASFVAFLPLSRRAPHAIRGFLEMMADDFATTTTSRPAVRAALAKAACFQRPPLGALGANDLVMERRQRRLELGPARRWDAISSIAFLSVTVSLVAALVMVG
jgi:Zn-dependent protease with chaperone function